MSNMFRCLIITNYVKNFHELPPAQYYVGVEQGCLAIIAAQKELFLATGDFDHVTTQEHATIKKNTQHYCLKTSQTVLDGEFAIQQVYRIWPKINRGDIFFVANSPELDLWSAGMNFLAHYGIRGLLNQNYILNLTLGVHQIPRWANARYFSVFSLLQKSVVSIFDAVYSVEKLAITPGSNCATRNVFLKNIHARIQVLQGAVTVVIPPLWR